jgi:hypothetical protein
MGWARERLLERGSATGILKRAVTAANSDYGRVQVVLQEPKQKGKESNAVRPTMFPVRCPTVSPTLNFVLDMITYTSDPLGKVGLIWGVFKVQIGVSQLSLI